MKKMLLCKAHSYKTKSSNSISPFLLANRMTSDWNALFESEMPNSL